MRNDRFDRILALVDKFNKANPDYKAELDKLDSYTIPCNHFVINITEPVCGMVSRYVFTSCDEFREWMDGVVLD